MNVLEKNPRLDWLKNPDICPYVYMRPENSIARPGHYHELGWFNRAPIIKNPLRMDEVDFADQIIRLEGKAFAASGMPMPRWVFYDCAIMPGFVAGYAIRRTSATQEMLDLLSPQDDSDWVPLSLFIMIPTLAHQEWVAHNLCSVNSLLPNDQKLYGLGFLSKAFGLWYANIKQLCGMTQWGSPAIKLHSHYGVFEVLTAYTPVHTYANTLTYRVIADVEEWRRFFNPGENPSFSKLYEDAGFEVNPVDELSLQEFQRKIELGGARFFLDSAQIRAQALNAKMKVYKLR